MKTPVWLASLIAASVLALQGWTLNEIVNLKVTVASLSARLDTTTNHIAQNK